MISLAQFNGLETSLALTLVAPCVAIPSWGEALCGGRPYTQLDDLHHRARHLAARWGESELAQALIAHPRIGEKPQTQDAHSALSRQEQGAVDDRDPLLTQSLQAGNRDYEQRFGRVFLIRAKGRSGEEILATLRRRLENTPAQELQASLDQLAEITLLRLTGVIGP